MIIFLYGRDNFRLYEASREIIEKYKQKHKSGVNFFGLDLSERGDLPKLDDAVKTISFFNEVKLVSARNAFSAVQLEDLISDYSLLDIKDLVVLLIENSAKADLVKRNKKLFSLLTSAKVIVREFEPLEGAKLKTWANRQFTKRQCEIAPNALNLLVNLKGGQSLDLIQEIEKLCNFKLRGVVTEEDVKLLSTDKIESEIFKFIDALGSRNKEQAFGLLAKEILSGQDPYYILSMLAYQFRNLLLIKDLISRNFSAPEISKKAALHPFVVRKTISNIRYFTLDDLKQKYGRLHDMEISAKNGKKDLIDGLYNFVLT